MKEKRGLEFHRFLSVLLIVIMVLSFFASDSMEVCAAGRKKTVVVGKTAKLTVSNPSKTVKWSVNKPNIVGIVGTSGRKKSTVTIKGKKAGKAVVTAKAGKKKQKITVTVKKSHVHSYTRPATCTEPARCTCGLTYGAPLGHQMSPATCQKPQTCIRCGATVGNPAPHNYDETTQRCIWCDQLNVRNFVDILISHTTNTGDYNVRFITLGVQNSGLVSFEILTQRQAKVFPDGEGAGIKVYLTDVDGNTYTENRRFVVLPATYDIAFYDTTEDTKIFTFKPEGILEFYASYGEHIYLFRVKASKMDVNDELIFSDYTFTLIS